jgi:hypothetical protein
MYSRTKTAKKHIVGARARRSHAAPTGGETGGTAAVRLRQVCAADINFPPVPTEQAAIEHDASFDYCVCELPR